MKMMINERTSPAMAIPRGALNKPTKEKIRPKNQRIKLTNGNQQKTSPNKAMIKPATPILFECSPSTTTVVVLFVDIGAVCWGCL